MLSYLRRNRQVMSGSPARLLLLFAGIGRLVWDVSLRRRCRSRPTALPVEHPLGTDRQGRDLLAVMIVATPLTLYIGLLAGLLGVVIGTALALIAAYYGGRVDAIIRGVVDVGLDDREESSQRCLRAPQYLLESRSFGTARTAVYAARRTLTERLEGFCSSIRPATGFEWAERHGGA